VLAMKNNPSDKWYNAIIHPLSKMKKKVVDLNGTADVIIDTYFLTAVSSQLAGEISYGQQKLLTLACCVANGAELLLLDEPVAGINPEYRKQMVGLLKQLRQEGKTILMIEHNTEFIEEVADDILFLSNGEVKKYNSFEHFRTDPSVIAAYIG
jgi:branched-chain amino acid transport system ATP-binding protein